MSIHVTCPTCERSFSVPDSYAGKRGKCPKCGGVFRAEASDNGESLGLEGLDFSTGSSNGHAVSEPASRISRQTKAAAPMDDLLGGALSVSPAGMSAGPAASVRSKTKTGKKTAVKGARSSKAKDPMPTWGWILIGVVVAVGLGTAGAVYAIKSHDVPVEQTATGDSKYSEELKKLETDVSTLESRLKSGKNSRSGEPNRGAKLLEEVLPAVVRIQRYPNDPDAKKGTKAEDFMGSGFFINDQQWIVTSYRCVENAVHLTAMLGTVDEKPVEGFLGGSQIHDIAVLKLKNSIPSKITPLRIADARDELEPGMLVYVAGNPGRHRGTIRRGIITRLVDRGRLMSEEHDFDINPRPGSQSMTYIEHDARVYPGDYGAPILNEKLEVIGVQSLLGTMRMNPVAPGQPGPMVQTFGLALHAKHIAEVLKDVNGSVRPYPKGPGLPTAEAPKTDAKPESKPDTKPEKKPDAKPETKPKPEPKTPAPKKPKAEAEDEPADEGTEEEKPAPKKTPKKKPKAKPAEEEPAEEMPAEGGSDDDPPPLDISPP